MFSPCLRLKSCVHYLYRTVFSLVPYDFRYSLSDGRVLADVVSWKPGYWLAIFRSRPTTEWSGSRKENGLPLPFRPLSAAESNITRQYIWKFSITDSELPDRPRAEQRSLLFWFEIIHGPTALLEGRWNGKQEELAQDRKGKEQQTFLSLLWSFETALLLRHNDLDVHSRAETDASGFQIMHWKGVEIYHVFTILFRALWSSPVLIEDKPGGVNMLPLLISLFTFEQGLQIQMWESTASARFWGVQECTGEYSPILQRGLSPGTHCEYSGIECTARIKLTASMQE